MSVLLNRRYDEGGSLDTNPPAGAEQLSRHGSDWLWATAIFVVTFLAIWAMSWRPPHKEKFFHYLFLVANLVGAIAYYAMASDLAYSVIPQVNSLSTRGATRQIFFAKYVFWVVSFPSVIIALGVLSGIPWITIIYHVALSWIWVIGYLVAAYTGSNYKWGFFVLATVAAFILWATIWADQRNRYESHHKMLHGWVHLLWLLYPIAWGLSDGGNRISVTDSFIFFGILDVLFLPVISIAFLILFRKWEFIDFTQRGRVHDPKNATTRGATAPGGVVTTA